MHLRPLEMASWAASPWMIRPVRGTSDPLRLACDCFVDQGRHQTKSVLMEAAWTKTTVTLLPVLLRETTAGTTTAVGCSYLSMMLSSGLAVEVDEMMLLRC